MREVKPINPKILNSEFIKHIQAGVPFGYAEITKSLDKAGLKLTKVALNSRMGTKVEEGLAVRHKISPPMWVVNARSMAIMVGEIDGKPRKPRKKHEKRIDKCSMSDVWRDVICKPIV